MLLLYYLNSLYRVTRQFENRQNKIETAIASNDAQFTYKYTKCELHLYIYIFIIILKNIYDFIKRIN